MQLERQKSAEAIVSRDVGRRAERKTVKSIRNNSRNTMKQKIKRRNYLMTGGMETPMDFRRAEYSLGESKIKMTRKEEDAK